MHSASSIHDTFPAWLCKTWEARAAGNSLIGNEELRSWKLLHFWYVSLFMFTGLGLLH